jgi:hypothetical protein
MLRGEESETEPNEVRTQKGRFQSKTGAEFKRRDFPSGS